jgi:hypothetical protein
VQYGGYLQRRASISAMDQLQGYAMDCLWFVLDVSLFSYVVEEDSSSEEEQPAAGASYSLAIDSDSDDEEAKKKQIQRRDSITRLRRLS